MYRKIYNRMVKLGIIEKDRTVCDYKRSQSKSYMDLVVERRTGLDGYCGSGNCIGLSIAHYYEQNGDLCSDPHMEFLYHPKANMVEAFSFEQSIPAIYQVVYPEPEKVFLQLKRDLNQFACQWLSNLIDQDHGKVWIGHSDQ